VNPARALRNDTTPPPETSLHFARGVQYMADLMAKTVEAPNWTKPDSYLQGSFACATTLSADSNRYLLASTLSADHNLSVYHSKLSQLLWPSGFSSTSPSLVFLDACVYTDAAKHLVLLVEDKKTTESQYLSLIYDNIRANIKAADFFYVSSHGLLAEPDLLEGYEQYQAANWDGRDAEPITAETLAYAHRLMKIMPTSLGAPDVAPAADGSIALEWIPESKTHRLDKLFLDIGPGEEWRAYWKLRNGEFRRSPNVGFSAETRTILKNIFDDLSA
jgi:hypothetical protein